MDTNGFSAWLEIDLDAIRNNTRRLIELTGTDIMAIVKADGYGHGAAAAARAAAQAGARWCGVARLEEAIALREAGIQVDLLVLGYTPPDRVKLAVQQNISLTVYDLDQGNAYARQADQVGGGLRLHVKVDTGMGRLGITPAQALQFLEQLRSIPLAIEWIFTHFARADEPDQPVTDLQIERFEQLLHTLREEGICPPIIHACNSAGAINFPQARYQLVRPGIALYGLHPSPTSPLPPGFIPALSWKTRLTSVRSFPPGHGISYGHRYTTTKEELIGSIAIGYADGYRRVDGNIALVGGVRAPVIGRVCMDQSMLQLDTTPTSRMGDEVVLIGKQNGESITAEEVAARWNTINYEVVCGLAARLPRVYLNE